MWTVAFRSTIALHYTAYEPTIQNERRCCQMPTKQEHTVGNGQVGGRQQGGELVTVGRQGLQHETNDVNPKIRIPTGGG